MMKKTPFLVFGLAAAAASAFASEAPTAPPTPAPWARSAPAPMPSRPAFSARALGLRPLAPLDIDGFLAARSSDAVLRSA